ncbi:hypothetical protein M6D81_00300 [Paenibacillus sp. J5C_2022]|uniref:DUF6115 domain-containing protein n=1 Tax=Paenibacillus sp. J5C2022 TaxID=2977129 RepID=UPI0021D00BE3|nr:hypothetical protein [Paenibacillus sp. J5C2022]MCU6707131.1 hypothetical protein [Paenibacillus sp. J5C2022]
MGPWQIIVLLGAVILVAAFLIPRNKGRNGEQGGSLQNMEIALEQFMENMEKDNGELMELLADSGKAAAEREKLYETRIARLEQTCSRLELQLQSLRSSNPRAQASAAVGMQVETQPQPDSVPPALVEDGAEPSEVAVSSTIQSRYASLLELHRNGKSIEAIARRMEMNKGEVQLILQLAKQEEAARA